MLTWDAYPAAPAEPLPGYGREDGADPDLMAPPGRVARLLFDPRGHFLVSMPQYQSVVRPPVRPATVWRPDGTRVADLPPVPSGTTPTAVAINPGGVWMAVGLTEYSGDGSRHLIRIWNLAAGKLLAEYGPGVSPDDLRPLPGGKLLAAVGGEVYRYPPRLAGRPELLPPATDEPPQVVRVAVAGNWLARAGKTRAIVWDTAGDLVATRMHKPSPQNGPVAFRPHTTVLAVGHGTVVDLWDFRSGTELVLKGHKRPVWAVGFSPDGGTAYTAASDGAVIAWDADTGAVRRRFDFGTSKLYSAAVAPDGLTMALGGDDGRVTVVDLDG